MDTHQIIKEDENQYCALGEGNWFSWHICLEFGEWVVSTIYGQHHGTFSSFDEALNSIT